MKLIYGVNSPFSRKCRAVIIEKNIAGVEMLPVSVADSPPELLAINPLATIPALATADGLHLCDSTVICEYLDSLPSSAPRLFVQEGGDRLCMMALAVMAEGIMSAAVACVMEGRRPAEFQYDAWMARKQEAVLRTIEKIAAVNLDFTRPISYATLNLAIALLYVDFRLPHIDWRSKHRALAVWVDEMKLRQSLAQTAPV